MPHPMFGTSVVAAPMAGGTSTPSFVTAVHRAGGLGFLAAGYKDPAVMAAEIRSVRSAGARFGMNVLVPDPAQLPPGPAVREALEAYRQELAPEARRYGVDLPAPRLDDDDRWQEKIELLLVDPVELVSFTFGLPGTDVVRRLRQAGSLVLATVTGVAEAMLAVEQGVDALVVQHSCAGGHSAAFLPGSPLPAEAATALGTTEDLVRAVRAAVGLPLVAAGGITDAAGVTGVLAAGADAAQVGTALLRTTESGTRQLHKDALASPRYTRTAMTRAFTGRRARALVNEFVAAHPSAPEAYPAVHHLTAPLRAAAAAAGDSERLNLWAGTGWRQAQAGPVAGVLARLLG